MPPWRQPFAITIHVYFSVMHVHMHVCMFMNVGACGGTPRHIHTHSHPPTRAGMTQITKYAIKLEQIKIIQLFRPKKVHVFCSCEPPGKNFPVFTLESHRPCSD